MQRNPNANLVRKHIWLDADDWLWINETFGGKLKPSEAIRLILRKYRQGVEARVAERAQRAAE